MPLGMFKVLLFCAIAFATLGSLTAAKKDVIGCRDDDGNLVDWFYLYKLPRKYSGKTTTGTEYLFMTPTYTNWTRSKFTVDSKLSMPGRTLAPAYNKTANSKYLVVMYNDQPPDMDEVDYDFTKGHAKGAVVANDEGGFWLVHSVPRFPPPLSDGSYEYPPNGHMYGQSFLCISMKKDQMKLVGTQLKFNEPNFYSTQIPKKLRNTYRTFVEALNWEKPKTPPFYKTVTLYSRDGAHFTSFAKSSSLKEELYEDLVAPYYNSGNFYVETWRHGSETNNIGTDCTKPTKIYNIKNITIEVGDKIKFATMSDHSKWMVSEDNHLICVGDINRQESQKVRGGGTVCIQDEDIADDYMRSIANSEPCPLRRNDNKIRSDEKAKSSEEVYWF